MMDNLKYILQNKTKPCEQSQAKTKPAYTNLQKLKLLFAQSW